jgi:hypothetical protein
MQGRGQKPVSVSVALVKCIVPGLLEMRIQASRMYCKLYIGVSRIQVPFTFKFRCKRKGRSQSSVLVVLCPRYLVSV